MSRVTSIAAISTDNDEQQRPHVAQRRGRRAARARQALGQGAAAQEEEPRSADDQPHAAQLRSELAHVGQREAEHRDRGQRRQGERGQRAPARRACAWRGARSRRSSTASRRAHARAAGAGTAERTGSACRATDAPGGTAPDSGSPCGRWPRGRAGAASRARWQTPGPDSRGASSSPGAPRARDRGAARTRSATATAAPANTRTKPAGPLHGSTSSRAGSNARSANGHGTRATHAASDHSASAAAAPAAGLTRVRLHSSSARPSSIAPAHCQPAERSSSRIASFLRELSSDSRASVIRAEAVLSAVGKPCAPHAPADGALVAGSSAVCASASLAACPSRAAASSSTAFARAICAPASPVDGVASADSTRRAAQITGAGPASSPCCSRKRSTNGRVCASIDAIASDSPRSSPRPSRCCSLSSSMRAWAFRTGSMKASRMRDSASLKTSGMRGKGCVAATVSRAPHKRARTTGSDSAACAAQTAGKVGSGSPCTRNPASANR